MGPGRWWYFKPSSTPPSPSQTTQKCQDSGTPGQIITTSAVVTPNGLGRKALKFRFREWICPDTHFTSKRMETWCETTWHFCSAHSYGPVVADRGRILSQVRWDFVGLGRCQVELGSVKRMSYSIFFQQKFRSFNWPKWHFLGSWVFNDFTL